MKVKSEKDLFLTHLKMGPKQTYNDEKFSFPFIDARSCIKTYTKTYICTGINNK